MFEQVIHSGLKDPAVVFFEVLHDAAIEAAHATTSWYQQTFCLTLLELSHELLEAARHAKTFSTEPGIDAEALCALPYKAALCAKTAFVFAATDEQISHAHYYHDFSIGSIEAAKAHLPNCSHPYEFGEIDQPPTLLQAVIT